MIRGKRPLQRSDKKAKRRTQASNLDRQREELNPEMVQRARIAAGNLAPGEVLALQGSLGNQKVGRLRDRIKAPSSQRLVIQRILSKDEKTNFEIDGDVDIEEPKMELREGSDEYVCTDGENYTYRATGVGFKAKVKVSGERAEGWQIGWAQTVYACHQYAVYQSKSGSKKHISTLGEDKLDGGEWYSDPVEVPEGNGAWSETIEFSDDPNIPVHVPYYNGKNRELKYAPLVETGGTKNFCAWLMATKDDEKIPLYHIKWTVDFSATYDEGKKANPQAGFKIETQGPGPGDAKMAEKRLKEKKDIVRSWE